MKKGVRKKKATSEVGPACRAGLSSTARTASERTSIERRRVAPGSTNVAVSLRRDEPFGTRLCAIWPVIFHYAFTCGGVHGVSQVKERGLITAERDGYICCLNVTTLPINQPAFGLRSRHVAKSGVKNRGKRTADFADGSHPCCRLPRAESAWHAISPMGDGTPERVSGEGIHHGR